jgi:hypothetical protein
MNILRSIILSLHLLLPLAVMAQEVNKSKNPLDYSLKQYGLILGIALLGGVVSWGAKVRKGELPNWSINHLIGELATSALAGRLCFWTCEWAGSAPLLTAALTGIVGHMGTKAMTMLEQWGQSRFPGGPTATKE